jgi:hypothetical protein
MSDERPNPSDAPPPSWTPPAAPDSTGPVTGSTSAPSGRSGVGITVTPELVIGLVAVVLLVLSLVLKEDGTRLWSALGIAWSLFALVAVVLAMLPSASRLVNITQRQAWQIAAIAAGALVFWWVLFVLPVIDRNVSFLATVAVAAACVAVWLSPGNTLKDAADTPTGAA